MVAYLKTKEEFDSALAEAGDKLVVIDFTASWCGPCKRIAPTFEQYSNDFPDVAFYKVDVDENDTTAQACGINCMPTFQFYKNGNQLKDETLEGASEEDLKGKIVKLK